MDSAATAPAVVGGGAQELDFASALEAPRRFARSEFLRWNSRGMCLRQGIQIMGPYWEDATPFTFAELLAREIGG